MAINKTPKNVKQAFDNDLYKLENIYKKGAKKIRVEFKLRFQRSGYDNSVQFWIDRDYFKSRYPKAYENYGSY